MKKKLDIGGVFDPLALAHGVQQMLARMICVTNESIWLMIMAERIERLCDSYVASREKKKLAYT